MTQRGPFLFLVVLLLVIGIGVAEFRRQEYRIPLLPGAQQLVWEVEARIVFRARGRATQAYLTLPPNQDGFRLVSEEDHTIQPRELEIGAANENYVLIEAGVSPGEEVVMSPETYIDQIELTDPADLVAWKVSATSEVMKRKGKVAAASDS